MEYREMRQEDIAAIFRVRKSTRENRMIMEELTKLDITPESVWQALYSQTPGYLNLLR